MGYTSRLIEEILEQESYNTQFYGFTPQTVIDRIAQRIVADRINWEWEQACLEEQRCTELKED